jgi:phosphoglycolate phosphatase-like HAD superfamily hydrolase
MFFFFMLQAIIFDHDGTMAPTMERQFAWFQKWWSHPLNEANIKGRDFPYPDLKSFLNMYNEKMDHPKEVQNVYDFLNLKCDMNDFTHPVWPAYKAFAVENPSTLYDGMGQAIKDLHEAGSLGSEYNKNNKRVRLGVNTSNSWSLVKGDLVKNDVLQYFDSYVSKEVLAEYHGYGGANYIKKPSNIPLAYSLNMLDSSGDTTLFVGDLLVDCAAGKKIKRLGIGLEENIRTIGITHGYAAAGEGKERAREELLKGVEVPGRGRVYFDYIVDTPQEIVNIAKDYMRA